MSTYTQPALDLHHPTTRQWYDDGEPPWFCDGPNGLIAHVWALPGDLSQYVVPKRWRYELCVNKGLGVGLQPVTKGTADTGDEAKAAAEVLLDAHGGDDDD